MKRFFLSRKSSRRGQSFTELALILLILALVLAGVIEYGFLLNSYLHVLDGAREGARISSNSNPFKLVLQADGSYKYDPGQQNYVFYMLTAVQVAGTMTPVLLNPTADPATSDDVVVSVFSGSYGGSPQVARYPIDAPDVNGWSLCRHFDEVVSFFFTTYHQGPPSYLTNPNWQNGNCVPRGSSFSSTDIANRLNSSAPGTGMILVEVYYHYSQVLKLPVLTSFLPDPVPLYTYTIMPLSSAEPTPTP